ncbi:related to Phospholipase Carboxylesterase superfamily [Lecanosticta acicola]|uniref:Related to Phospholipase Carboxylesterase superfamily n=1 Tax=Lecanosticta acicola TaxID=111012 RepID=A0AAI8Z5R6_9PEZI|nr:related to Phospholipase Carboxylesterase superfamily [Lecanosticta acicola]
MPTIPKREDFPANLKLDLVPPPKGDEATNILVLLHGLGDHHASFAVLGGQMNLPETACISISGPSGLLDLGGFHWGDDIIFDSTSGGLDADSGFKQATEMLQHVVKNVLVDKCNYSLRDIIFFGFGQGGMAALNLAVALEPDELGGIVSIGAGLPSEAPATLDPKSKTPVLVCAGSDQSSVTSASEEKLKRVFESVEIKRYRKPGDSMPSNRDEMMPIMQFFSRRMKSTKGVPKGSVEIG